MVQQEPGTAAGEGPRIRMATPDDAEALLAIYAPYVRDTAITFEWDVPSVEDFRQRIAHTLERYPYLVAESTGGRALGYAYAGPLKERKVPASSPYTWCRTRMVAAWAARCTPRSSACLRPWASRTSTRA